MAEWSHLPNAAHISRVLVHLAQNPEAWSAAWDAAWDAARGAARDAAWDAARGAARDAARGAAWGALSALIAYDDCAHLLDQTPGFVRGHINLTNEPAAILLLPAVIAMQGESYGVSL